MPDVLAPAAPASVAGGTGTTGADVSQTADAGSTTEVLNTGLDTTGSDVAVGDESTGTDTVETSTETQDGRVMPKWLKEMQATSPEAYKAAKAAFFSERAFRQHFSNPQEAQKARELLEAIGGEEGWNQTQQAQQEQEQLDGLYYSRNPQKQRDFVKHLLTQDAGAFRTIVPVALEEFYQSDPQAYSRALAPIIANTFAGAFNRFGVGGVLGQVKQLLKTNPDQAMNLIEQLEQWTGQFAELAQSKPQVDPEREAFEREREEFETSKKTQGEQQFNNAYRSDSGAQAQAAVMSHLKSLMPGRNLDKDTSDILTRNIFQEVTRMATQDQNYMRQLKAILARRDQKAATRYFMQKFNQLLPEAAKKVNRVFNLNGVKAAPKKVEAPSATPAAKGVIQLTKAPKPSEVDYRKTPDAMITRGEAWLKDGRRVKWE